MHCAESALGKVSLPPKARFVPGKAVHVQFVLQVPGAVQTLHTHSMAAHGRSTGAYNTPVTTQ